MNRMHIGISVENLDNSVRFYSDLFGTQPTMVKSDYAKWLLDDPCVNFSITEGRESPGDVHFGIQVENKQALTKISNRLKDAGQTVLDEGPTTCCYHRSDKAWVLDPQNFRWETFLSTGETTEYGEDTPELEAIRKPATAQPDRSCC